MCRKLIKAQSVDAIGFGEIFLFSGKKLFSIFVQRNDCKNNIIFAREFIETHSSRSVCIIFFWNIFLFERMFPDGIV